MAGFLHWLALQYEDVRLRLRREHAELRDRALGEATHPRTPGIVADLALGLKYFGDFALSCGAFDAADREQMARSGWQALLEAAADQTEEIKARDPCRRFLELVAGAITSERYHLAGRCGQEPDSPEAWGWRLIEVDTGNHQRREWRPQGRLLGWVDGSDVFLDPEEAFTAAQRLADEQGERLPLSQRQLYRRLKEQRLLASWEEEKTTTRRTLQGRERSVLHLPIGALSLSQNQGEPGEQGE